MSEKKRTYRQFTPEQKAEIVLAGIRADRSVRDVCRETPVYELPASYAGSSISRW